MFRRCQRSMYALRMRRGRWIDICEWPSKKQGPSGAGTAAGGGFFLFAVARTPGQGSGTMSDGGVVIECLSRCPILSQCMVVQQALGS